MKFRRLIKLSSILIMTLLIALAGICNNTSAKTTSTKSYSLLVRRVEWLTRDVGLNNTSLTLYKGKTFSLKMQGTTKKIKWSSSNKKIATVTSKGVVKGVKKGTATITAKVGGKSYKCKVTVKNPSLTVNASKVAIGKGNTFQITATPTPSATVTYKSSKKKVATVSKTGLVKGIKKGTATITVKANGITKSVKVTVTQTVDKEAEKNKIIDLYRKIIKAGGLYNYSEDLDLSEYLYDIDSDSRIAYAMMDLNADGEDEIVITDQDVKGLLADVYRWNGKKYVQVYELTSMYRGNSTLLDGNYIALTGGSSAFESDWEYCTLDKNCKPVYKECIYYNEYEDEDHPWFYVKGSNDFNKAVSITENKAYSIINSYKTKSFTSTLIK